MSVTAKDYKQGNGWAIYNGDCCEVVKDIPSDSVDFSVFSPPFASLYVYSDIVNDMGNCESDEEFFQHFSFLVSELLRIVKSGRLVSVHCTNFPAMLSIDGYIGRKDFRGDIIRCFRENGWIYHSEVVVWKDPVVEMQRTKALGLLHKQVVKDSSMSRQGIPDYVCTFRKPGKNQSPIAGGFDHFAGESFERTGDLSIDIWQRYASPVWMDIRQSRTLNARPARDENDVRHVCPLQLDVIHRCLQLWSNPGDVVFSPFTGIGSEGYEAILCGRKFLGVELKESYFDEACKNLADAQAKVENSKSGLLFDLDTI